MRTNRIAGPMLWSLIAITWPVGLDAQGAGSGLRHQAADVAGDAKQEGAQQRSPFNDRAIEITGPAVAGLEKGLDTEIALLVEFAKHLTTYKTLEERQICETRVAMSPEGMKLMDPLLNMRDGATADEMLRISEKIGKDMAVLVTRMCGPDIVADWPEWRRREKLEEIQRKAAAAAGPVRSSEGPRQGGPAASGDAGDTAWIQEPGMSLHAYQIFKERVYAYCNALKAGTIQPGQGVKFPGTGEDIFWVFTDDEARAIAPLCPNLLKKIRITIAIEEITVQSGKKLTLEKLDVIIRKVPD
jgi:hypothetical protein